MPTTSGLQEHGSEILQLCMEHSQETQSQEEEAAIAPCSPEQVITYKTFSFFLEIIASGVYFRTKCRSTFVKQFRRYT
jgi:hypothetical protein